MGVPEFHKNLHSLLLEVEPLSAVAGSWRPSERLARTSAGEHSTCWNFCPWFGFSHLKSNS